MPSSKGLIQIVRFDVFTAVKIQVQVFCDVTQRSVAVGYQRFGGPCCLHLQGGDSGDLGVHTLIF